jgi:hypothetical protein
MSAVPEPSPAAGAASVEDVKNMAACRYVDFPGIGTVDLDTTELLSNDREMLEVTTKRMFSQSSILETIASVESALHKYESADSSAPPPRRRRRREFSTSPRPARSRPHLRPHHRRP